MTDDAFTRAMYGHHVFADIWEGRRTPRGLCGVDDCVYMAGHTVDHSWMRPFSTAPEPDQ